jgi:hypothetical protein
VSDDVGYPAFIKTTIPSIVNNPLVSNEDFIALNDSMQTLKSQTEKCEVYENFKYAVHAKNTCLMAKMYTAVASGTLESVLNPLLSTENDKRILRDLTAQFKSNQIAYNNGAQDSYITMVEKFNAFEANGIVQLASVPSTYNYQIPAYENPKQAVASPSSYKCVSFDMKEQQIISDLQNRKFGTPTDIKRITDTVRGNLCAAKGSKLGGTGNYNGCTGCMGCCQPSNDDVSAADKAAITGVNTLTAAGTLAGPGAQATCPQPKLREYRLNRKPAKFRKIKAPTPAFMECFEDATVDNEPVHSSPLNVRETMRAQKSSKMFGLKENPWIQ